MPSPRPTIGRFAAALFALTLVASACGKSGDGGGDGNAARGDCPVDAFKEASGTTKVVVWSSYVGKTQQTLEKLAAAYNASQDKVEVQVEVQGTSYAELLRKFQQAIPTGNLPAITIGEDTETQFMVDSGVVLPAQDCIEADEDPRAKIDDLLPAVKAAYTVDGVQYPASMNVSTIVLYYNRDHFRRAGLDPDAPPKTLDELRTTAERLKAAGVSNRPFVMKQDPWFIEAWTTGAGETLVNNNNGRDKTATAATLENDATRTALEWLAGMKRDGLLNAVAGTEGQINHYLAMATQDSSMLIETSTAITTIDGVLTGTFDPADLGLDPNLKLPPISLDLGVAPNPGLTGAGRGQVGGGAWYLTNTGSDEVQSAAWDFVKFFNEVSNQVIWTQEGSYLPIRDAVRKDPTIEADWSTTNRGKWLATAYSALLTLDPDFPGALIGPYDKFRDALRTAQEAIVQNDAEIGPALAKANADATKAIKDYADSNF